MKKGFKEVKNKILNEETDGYSDSIVKNCDNRKIIKRKSGVIAGKKEEKMSGKSKTSPSEIGDAAKPQMLELKK